MRAVSTFVPSCDRYSGRVLSYVTSVQQRIETNISRIGRCAASSSASETALEALLTATQRHERADCALRVECVSALPREQGQLGRARRAYQVSRCVI